MIKKILVTGSTDGIGKLTAIELLKKGHSVYIHGRSKEKVENVISEIKDIDEKLKVQGFVSDFSDLNSVKIMVEEIREQVGELDIIINNAGIYTSPIQHGQQGLDIRITVNYLAPFVLTYELIDILKEDSRIINLGSAAQSPVNLEIFESESSFSEGDAYAQSKLALTMWSFYLSKEFSNITTIVVNPGSLLNTKMANEAFGRSWSPAEKGVKILCDLAIVDSYSKDSGKYFDNDREEFNQAHPDSYDNKKIQKLIERTKQLI